MCSPVAKKYAYTLGMKSDDTPYDVPLLITKPVLLVEHLFQLESPPFIFTPFPVVSLYERFWLSDAMILFQV